MKPGKNLSTWCVLFLFFSFQSSNGKVKTNFSKALSTSTYRCIYITWLKASTILTVRGKFWLRQALYPVERTVFKNRLEFGYTKNPSTLFKSRTASEQSRHLHRISLSNIEVTPKTIINKSVQPIYTRILVLQIALIPRGKKKNKRTQIKSAKLDRKSRWEKIEEAERSGEML